MRYKSALNYYCVSLKTLYDNFSWQQIVSFLLKKNDLIKVQNLQFRIKSFMDLWTLKEVIVDDVYRLNNFEVGGGDVLIDIGASIGDFSVLAEKVGFQKIIAYELDKNRIDLCNQNLSLNQCTRVKLFAKEAKSLDEIFRISQLEKCDFLKLDCEGAEYQIFRNSKNSIKKIKFVAMEAHLFNESMLSSFNWLKKMLSENGFSISIIPNPVHSNICYLFAENKAAVG